MWWNSNPKLAFVVWKIKKKSENLFFVSKHDKREMTFDKPIQVGL